YLAMPSAVASWAWAAPMAASSAAAASTCRWAIGFFIGVSPSLVKKQTASDVRGWPCLTSPQSGDGGFVGAGIALVVDPLHHDLVAFGGALELERQERVL